MTTLSDLSPRQRRMLTNALTLGDNDKTGWGYAPCGRGFAATMRSLVRLGLAIATGSEANIRGIILTRAGRALAEAALNSHNL